MFGTKTLVASLCSQAGRGWPGLPFFSVLALSLIATSARAASQDEESKRPAPQAAYDLVVVGATPAGIAAAISGSRSGLSVALFEEHERIGGMPASGMSNTDYWYYESLSGLFREFTDRVELYYRNNYGPDSEQLAVSERGTKYEPKVALAVFQEMLGETEVEVFTGFRLVGAEVENEGSRRKLRRAELLNLDTGQLSSVEAKVFVDATYEGDLLAAAGARYRLGSEGRDVFGEEQAPAESNEHIMGYNFRVLVTKDPELRIPFERPEGYDPEAYPKLVAAAKRGELTKLDKQLIQILPIPNQKANLNDYKSSLYEGFQIYNLSDEWPEATPERREEIWREAERMARSFFYFLANDERLPQHVREEMSLWGYSRDEFAESGHFPPWLYVREGRRLVGLQTLTAHDVVAQPGSERSRAFPDAIAMGSFPMNSHGTHIGPEGKEYGNFLIRTKPFQVPYGAMVPEEIDGLLVPVALSASQLAFGAVRMEPTWTVLGQAAGLAAAQAVKRGAVLRGVDVERLQQELHRGGAATFFTNDVPADSPFFVAVQYFGNRGLFQELHENPGEAEGDRPGYHHIYPDLPMTPELAYSWMEYVKEELGEVLDEELESRLLTSETRGEFLRRLYEAAGGRPNDQTTDGD